MSSRPVPRRAAGCQCRDPFWAAGFDYGSHIADVVLRPRFHLGTSINVNGKTSQLYSGFTWDIPLINRLSLELTFGGSLHDGPNTGVGSSFGCPLNFREIGLDWACLSRNAGASTAP